MHFHLWFPELFSCKGGIQTYSAFFLQAIQNLYPQSSYDVFLKHDIRANPEINYLPQTKLHFAGGYPLKIRTPVFASCIATAGLIQRPNLAIATHLNFTIAAYWLKRLIGIPYWAVAHGIEAWDVQNPTLKTALAHADLILAVSEYTRSRLIQQEIIPPEKISLLPNTVDTNRFQIRPKPAHLLRRYNLHPEQPIILTVARLSSSEQYKGYDKIIHALAKIRYSIPDIHYILVGKGDDKERIEQLIAAHNVDDCVTLTGFVPDEELADHYNLCDVFAMPSQGEGFGIVYLEALASGKPTLAGNQDGAVDALCHGELGALVNPEDTEVIAQTLIQIIQKKHLNTLIYQPQLLREKIIVTFGFERFQQNLGSYLKDFITVDR